MVSLIVIAPVVLVAYWAFTLYSGLQKNIAAAKRTGLPYVISPIHLYSRWWLITNELWIPLIRKLPSSWIEPWVNYLKPDWVWQQRYAPFAKHGDTFLTVSSNKILVWSAEAEVIHQVTQQKEAFPKPLESYAILDIYGRNILSTEGQEWRQHRKVSSPSFTEKNNALVFKEAIAQTQSMIRKWLGPEGKGDITVNSVPSDALRVTLHIISMIGFGVKLLWPGEEANDTDIASGVYGHDVPEGHTMSFEEALESLLDNLIWVLITPKWILKRLPFRLARLTNEAYENWGQYMNELFARKIVEAQSNENVQGMDIMGGLVRSAYGDKKAMGERSNGRAEKAQPAKLSDSDILGNAFVMIIAGHETTANSLHFSLMMLASNPGAQRRLQKEIHSVLGDADPSTWKYESNINTLLGGMAGAVLNEELRLMPPVISIPKSVRSDQDQHLNIKGQKHLLPRGTFINLVAVVAQRNPKYWPSRGPSKISNADNDLDDFIPERWLKDGAAKNVGVKPIDQIDSEEEEFGGYTGTNSAGDLFRPVRGSFVPFSDGGRSCLGRRLAQVEIMAILSTIFQKYSIELAVDEFASDAQVAKMTDQEKKGVYIKARTKAEEIIRTASTRITLKLHDSPNFIPVRIVPKGEERFINLIE